MPGKDYFSPSLSIELRDEVLRVLPKLGAKPEDGRRRDSLATAIEFLVRKAIKDLDEKGLLPGGQAPLVLYDEGRCDDCGRKATYADNRGPGRSIRRFCEECRADRWEPDLP